MKKKLNAAERAALYGVLIALAMVLSYVEFLIPISIGIPGVKLGLANLVVFIALYCMRPIDAFFISMIRILLTGITFGNTFALLYSFSGGILSFAVMYVCKKKDWFSKTGISITGGISHNIGQLIVAAFVLENTAVFTYFPMLLAAGAVTGALIGLLGSEIVIRLTKMTKK